MKFKIFLPFLIASASFCSLSIFQDANASIKDLYNQRLGCSWKTAQYQSKGLVSNENGNKVLKRYCITGDKRVVEFRMNSDGTMYGGHGRWATLKGFIGASEGWFDSKRSTNWNQTQFEIEGDELVKYSCIFANAVDCGNSSPSREVLARKRKK